MTRYWCGIDPGLSGAIAFLPEKGDPVAYPLPLMETDHGQREVDGCALISLLEDFLPSVVMIELIQGFGGASSACKLGQAYGSAIVATLSSRIRLERVRPQAWQKAVLGLTSGKRNDTKAASIAFVRDTYPKVSLRNAISRVKTCHNIADAVCLAHYARSLYAPLA
jgi:Holliday junction resolvasome RuvABC endonuclease subunit